MSGNAKRNIVVATMAVLVCAAVGLNWKYSSQEAVQQAEETGTKILGEAALVSGQEDTGLAEDTVYEGDDYFASARLTRQQARDSAISLLEDAASQEDADQETANQASESIQVLASYTLKRSTDRKSGDGQGLCGLRGLHGGRRHQHCGIHRGRNAGRRGCSEDHGHCHDGDRLRRQRHSHYGGKLAVVFF